MNRPGTKEIRFLKFMRTRRKPLSPGITQKLRLPHVFLALARNLNPSWALARARITSPRLISMAVHPGPLPRGEGRGEGEPDVPTKPRLRKCLARIFHTWKGPGPPTQVGTARCAVPAACSGGAAWVVPGSVAMPRGERSAPERRGDAAARRVQPHLDASVLNNSVEEESGN